MALRIPQPTNIVFLYWEKNPLRPQSARRIRNVSIVGNASPCVRFLVIGRRLQPALNCLQRNGFRVVCQRSSGVNGFLVLQKG